MVRASDSVVVATSPPPAIEIALAELPKLLAASTTPEPILTVPRKVFLPRRITSLLLPLPELLAGPRPVRNRGRVPVTGGGPAGADGRRSVRGPAEATHSAKVTR